MNICSKCGHAKTILFPHLCKPVPPSPLQLSCDACDAKAGEPCRPGCLGYAIEHGDLTQDGKQ